jgi:hypothetical protein
MVLLPVEICTCLDSAGFAATRGYSHVDTFLLEKRAHGGFCVMSSLSAQPYSHSLVTRIVARIKDFAVRVYRCGLNLFFASIP